MEHCIPVKMGKNKTRGNSTGYMVDGDSIYFPKAMNNLRNTTYACLKAHGTDPTNDLITRNISQLLNEILPVCLMDVDAFQAEMNGTDIILWFGSEDRLLAGIRSKQINPKCVQND